MESKFLNYYYYYYYYYYYCYYNNNNNNNNNKLQKPYKNSNSGANFSHKHHIVSHQTVEVPVKFLIPRRSSMSIKIKPKVAYQE